MFIDKAHIHLKAGNGGNGSVAFRREIYVPAGGPNGGDGGHGGNIILVVDTNMRTLMDFKYKIEAEIVVDEYAINLSILDFKCYCEERIFT